MHNSERHKDTKLVIFRPHTANLRNPDIPRQTTTFRTNPVLATPNYPQCVLDLLVLGLILLYPASPPPLFLLASESLSRWFAIFCNLPFPLCGDLASCGLALQRHTAPTRQFLLRNKRLSFPYAFFLSCMLPPPLSRPSSLSYTSEKIFLYSTRIPTEKNGTKNHLDNPSSLYKADKVLGLRTNGAKDETKLRSGTSGISTPDDRSSRQSPALHLLQYFVESVAVRSHRTVRPMTLPDVYTPCTLPANSFSFSNVLMTGRAFYSFLRASYTPPMRASQPYVLYNR